MKTQPMSIYVDWRKLRSETTVDIKISDIKVFISIECSTFILRWLEFVISETLPSATELEDSLQSGVILCKLGMKLLPSEAMWKKVYDLDQTKFKVSVLVEVVNMNDCVCVCMWGEREELDASCTERVVCCNEEVVCIQCSVLLWCVCIIFSGNLNEPSNPVNCYGIQINLHLYIRGMLNIN